MIGAEPPRNRAELAFLRTWSFPAKILSGIMENVAPKYRRCETSSDDIRPMRSSSRIEGDFQNLVGSSPNRTLHPFWPNFRAGGHGSRMSVQWVVTKAVDQSLWCVNVRRSVPAPQPILPAVLRRSCTATQEAFRVPGSRPPGTRLRSRRLTAQAARTHIGCCGPARLARMEPRPPKSLHH